jgi:hypothetical protein
MPQGHNYPVINIIDLINKPDPDHIRAGGHKKMSSILADQWRSRKCAQMRGKGGVAGSQPMSTAVHRSANKLTSYLTYAYEVSESNARVNLAAR